MVSQRPDTQKKKNGEKWTSLPSPTHLSPYGTHSDNLAPEDHYLPTPRQFSVSFIYYIHSLFLSNIYIHSYIYKWLQSHKFMYCTTMMCIHTFGKRSSYLGIYCRYTFIIQFNQENMFFFSIFICGK